MRASVLALGLVMAAAGCPEAQAGRPAEAGDSAGVQGRAGLTVITSPDSALVAIDGVPSGAAPLVIDSLRAGQHWILITRRDTANWLEDPVADTVELAPGEHRVFKYTLGVSYALSSAPSGATVLLGGIPAGRTPMVVRGTEAGLVPPITLRLEGYETVQVDLTRASRGALLVPLHRLWSANPSEERGGG